MAFGNVRRILAQFGFDLFGAKPDFTSGFMVAGAEVTASAAELNKADGLTASTAELNKLTGVTASTAELNKLTGVTASTAELNKLTGVTASTADLNKIAGLNADGASIPRVAVVDLAALDTAGGVLAWQNPTGGKIVVTEVILDITTKSTDASTIDVGYAANGTTSNDALMDGLDTGTGVVTYNNVDNKGKNGLGKHSTTMTSGQFITASKASGACAGLVGKAYIFYCKA